MGAQVDTVHSRVSSIFIQTHASSKWSSQAASNPSTTQAQCCLTSIFEWKMAFPTWHGRGPRTWECEKFIRVKYSYYCSSIEPLWSVSFWLSELNCIARVLNWVRNGLRDWWKWPPERVHPPDQSNRPCAWLTCSCNGARLKNKCYNNLSEESGISKQIVRPQH